MAKDALAKVDTFSALAPIGDSNTGFSRSEVMAENLGAGGLSPNDLDRVKTPAGGGTAWEIPTLDGKGDIAKELEVIIVAASDVRAYYSDKFNGDNSPPDCFSSDCITGNGDPGGPCDACEFSQWGTAVDDNGEPTGGQACNKRKMMLCIGKDSTLPFVISAPPSSLKSIAKYFMRLAGASLPYYGVVTSLTLEKAKSGGGITYSLIVPEFVRTLTEEEVPAIQQYRANLLPMFQGMAPRSTD
jgi:hypothetical protein